MPQPWRPNIAVSLVLFIGGAILVYYVLHTNGWSSGVSLPQVWAGLSKGMRAWALAGLIASAYGLGAIINDLAAKKN